MHTTRVETLISPKKKLMAFKIFIFVFTEVTKEKKNHTQRSLVSYFSRLSEPEHGPW